MSRLVTCGFYLPPRTYAELYCQDSTWVTTKKFWISKYLFFFSEGDGFPKCPHLTQTLKEGPPEIDQFRPWCHLPCQKDGKGGKKRRDGGAHRRTSTCTTTTHICVQQAKKMMIIGEAKTGFLSTVLKFPDYGIIHEKSDKLCQCQ